VLQGKDLSEALRDVQPGSVLDFRYFVIRIEPILATPGPDGKACVFCHASHVIFKLEPPNPDGVFSDQDSKDNYKYAMRVVDITNPEKSLILVKPTRPTDSAGNVGDCLATHRELAIHAKDTDRSIGHIDDRALAFRHLLSRCDMNSLFGRCHASARSHAAILRSNILSRRSPVYREIGLCKADMAPPGSTCSVGEPGFRQTPTSLHPPGSECEITKDRTLLDLISSRYPGI
jgi:hypothetical protein